jgi:hypothetical protein
MLGKGVTIIGADHCALVDGVQHLSPLTGVILDLRRTDTMRGHIQQVGWGDQYLVEDPMERVLHSTDGERAKLGIRFLGWENNDRSARTRYGWYVEDARGQTVGEGDDFRGTAGTRNPFLPGQMQTLTSMLGAAADAERIYMGSLGRTKTESFDLFPDAVREFAHQFSDEIAMLGFELSERMGVGR